MTFDPTLLFRYPNWHRLLVFWRRRIDGVIYQFCQLQHSHIRPDLTVVMADGPIDIDYVSFGRRRVEEANLVRAQLQP